MARGSRETGSTMMARGGRTTAHNHGDERHNDGKGQQEGDRRHNNGNGRHNDTAR